MLRIGGMSAKKKIKDYFSNSIDVRSRAYLCGSIRIELLRSGPVSCVGKQRITAIVQITDTVKVDKFHKLCYSIIRSILQDKYVFRFQVKAEKARIMVIAYGFGYRFAECHILR